MKNSLSLALCLLMLIAANPGCNSSGSMGKSASIHFQETPKTYVLIDEDNFSSMPTVTLYKNGNARLSQPLISSMALIGLGRFQVSGDEITVSYEHYGSATFAISDGGDTLTLESSSIGFTKVGAVYQCRSKKDLLSKYCTLDGEKLTLELLRELAPKANTLTFEDFRKYEHVDMDPDDHVFDVEGLYTLRVLCDAEGITAIMIERNESGERFPLNFNGSTGLVFDDYLGIEAIPKYQTQKWLDYYFDEKLPWDASVVLSLPEFPGVVFTWTSAKLTANGNDLIMGMPVWNVYLTDLTNDGKPEFCATVSFGSGIIDTRVIVYDFANRHTYQLADRSHYDYYLSMQDGKLMVTQAEYRTSKPLVTSELRLVNGEIAGFGTRTRDPWFPSNTIGR